MSGDACGTGACETCAFGCAQPTARRPADDPAVATAAGVAIAVLAGVLTLSAPRWVAIVAAAAATAGAATSVGGRRLPWLLPAATGLLLLALVARIVGLVAA